MNLLVSYHLPDKRVRYQINTDLVLQTLVDANFQKIYVIDPHRRCRVSDDKLEFLDIYDRQVVIPDNCLVFAAFYQDIDTFLDACGQSANRKIISVWHGIPIRCINLLDKVESSMPVFEKAQAKKDFLFHLVSSDFINEVTTASWNAKPENVITIGNIRKLSRPKSILWPHSEKDKVVIFCPSNAAGEFFNSVSARLGLTTDDDELDALLSEHEITLYHKSHGQASEIEVGRRSNIRDLPESLLDFYSIELNHLFEQIDLMISDCSSLMVDFLDFGKPVIFSSPTQQYLSRHDFNFDPGLLYGRCPTNAAELVSQINQKLGARSLDRHSELLRQTLGSANIDDTSAEFLNVINMIYEAD